MDTPRLRRNLVDAARVADERSNQLQLRVATATEDSDDETAGLVLRAAFQAGLSTGLRQAADAMADLAPSDATPGFDARAARAVVAEGGSLPDAPALPEDPQGLLDALAAEVVRARAGLTARRLEDLADGLAGIVYAAHLAAAALGVRLEPLVQHLADSHVSSLDGSPGPRTDVAGQLEAQGWMPTT